MQLKLLINSLVSRTGDWHLNSRFSVDFLVDVMMNSSVSENIDDFIDVTFSGKWFVRQATSHQLT